ncbi:YwdI family protein [Aquibacillus rhizosphaerae]|uniref:YwdI family protein n=1 Tax=Aquibacillus rhizosphaerae TaxID=3051431 RepID=A0ABT7L790_9BACI|nr:YwdI family protein [Aquibacillus sp. LR5S19]MDL4841713.1 YwdI family protein [Aquibacillus sp. LR5S19]
MAISNKVVLQKMIAELQKAMEKEEQSDGVREHVRAVQLLGDLILESDQKNVNHDKLNQDLELKKMMGNIELPKSTKQTSQSQASYVNHGEANGDSIFDF